MSLNIKNNEYNPFNSRKSAVFNVLNNVLRLYLNWNVSNNI